MAPGLVLPDPILHCRWIAGHHDVHEDKGADMLKWTVH